MATIDQLIRNIKQVKANEVVADSIDATKNVIKHLQQIQMLMGEKSTGKKIGKYKSIPYAIKKFNVNSLAGFGNVDLYLTGEFQGDIFIDVREKSFVLDSGNEKTAKLEEKYGSDIWDLNTKHKAEYIKEHLQPEGVKRFTQSILK